MSSLFEDGPDDVADAIVKLSRRVRELEETLTDPTSVIGTPPPPPTNDFPAGIIVGEIEVTGVVEDPTDLTVTTTVFYNDVMAFFSWTDPGTQAVEFEIEYSVKVSAGVYENPQFVRTLGINAQASGLRAQTTYGARIWSLNRIGRRSGVYPAIGYIDFTTGNDTTIPALLTGLTIGRGATTVVVTVNEATDVDVKGGKGLYEFNISTNNTFSPLATEARSVKSSARVVAFSDVLAEQNWYGRVRAIDEFGNEGPWSAVAGPTVAGGVIDSMVIAGLSAAKITYGEMSGDRLQANTASISVLKTSSLTAADITLAGGSLKAGSPPSTGLLLNSQGLRLYSGGNQVVVLDANGTASFLGNITGGTINIGSRFSVDSIGTLTATNANISGNVTASAIQANVSISAPAISGGTISIGSRFSVTNDGTLYANNANVSGNVTASSIVANTSISSPTITGAYISGTTVVGSTFRTRDSNSRVEINGNGNTITFYDDFGNWSQLYQGTSTGLRTSGSMRIGNILYASGVVYANIDASNQTILGNGTVGRTDINSTRLTFGSTVICDHNSGSTANFRCFNLTVDGTYSNPSDMRLKRGVKPLGIGALGDVMSTPVVTFERLKKPPPGTPKRTERGWLAQDAPASCVVELDPSPYDDPSLEGPMLGISMNEMVATLWRAVQELSAVVDTKVNK